MPGTIEQPVLPLQLSQQLVAFVVRLNRNAQHHVGPERRAEPREPVVLPVVAQPIDERRRPIGYPMALVTRDLSTWGIGLVHEQPMVYDRLALRLNVDGEEVLLIGDVRWRGPLGPFYSCGCHVVAKLDQFPELPQPQVHCLSGSPRRIDPPQASFSFPA